MTIYDWTVVWALLVCTALGCLVGYSKGWAEGDAYRKCMDDPEHQQC